MASIKIIENNSEVGAGTRGASLGTDALRVVAWNKTNNYFNKYEHENIPTENHILGEESETPWGKRINIIVDIYSRVSNAVKNTLVEGKHFPIVLAGDHSSAGGTIAGIKMANPNKTVGVIWIDAHGDLHTPYTSPSGNVHGMPLATALAADNLPQQQHEINSQTKAAWEALKNMGGISPKITNKDLVFFAVRDTEAPEDFLIESEEIRNIKVHEIRERGAKDCAQEALDLLSHTDIIYISFDVDSMDCDLVSHGTGTPVKDGLTPYEAKTIIEEIVKSGKLGCFEMVEINPTLDEKKNKMAEVAFDILENTTILIEKHC